MKIRKGVPYIVGVVIIAVFCLIFWAAEAGWTNFSIEHKLNPVDLATLCVSIFIAFFLQYYFASKATDDRAEKDILIDNLRDVFVTLRECRDAVVGFQTKISEEGQKNIIAVFRRLSNRLENIETALEMSSCSELRAECKLIADAFFSYKAAATSKLPNPYDPSDLGGIEQTSRLLNRNLHSLAFKINQHR